MPFEPIKTAIRRRYRKYAITLLLWVSIMMTRGAVLTRKMAECLIDRARWELR